MTAPVLKPIGRNAYAWIGTKGDSNAAAVATADGLIAIDAQQTPKLAASFRKEIETAASAPVTQLIDSHVHLDHTAGNSVFSDVPIVAHQRTKEILETVLGSSPDNRWTVRDYDQKLKLFFGLNIDELVPAGSNLETWFKTRIGGPDYEQIDLVGPSETFSNEMAVETLDDTLIAEYRGPAHCDGDLILRLPRQKIAFLGDLLFIGRFPWLGDCDLTGWVSCLNHILSLDLVTIVPGHGDVSTLKDVADFRDLLVALSDPAQKAVNEGWSEEAALATIRLSQYAHLPRYREWLEPNIRSAYRYFKDGR